jgi:DNA-directed RNA polymerase subunit RPC12/RpoP
MKSHFPCIHCGRFLQTTNTGFVCPRCGITLLYKINTGVFDESRTVGGGQSGGAADGVQETPVEGEKESGFAEKVGQEG